MKTLLKLAARILLNSLGIYLSAKYIAGFHFTGTLSELLLLGIILTILNFVVKPILKLIFSPVIVLTLGLGLILVNAAVLYILDILSVNLSIEGAIPLILSGLLFSVLNFIFHFVL